jgi:hypothetical protein
VRAWSPGLHRPNSETELTVPDRKSRQSGSSHWLRGRGTGLATRRSNSRAPSCSTRRSGTTRQSCPRARGFRVELESPRTKRAIPTCRVMSECVIPTCCRVATRDPTGGKQGMWTSERTHRARARASLALLRVLDSSTGTALPRSGC